MLFCERLWFSSPHLDFHWKFFALINFFSGAACQSCLLPGHTKFLRNNSLLQNRVLNHFQNSVEIVQNFNEVSPVGLSKLNYTSPVEQFEEKVLLFEKDAFIVNLGLWKKNFHPFFEFFSTQLSKLHSKCPKEHLEEKDSFSGKNCIFSSIWEIETNFSTFCRYFYGKLIKFALYVSQQRIWGKKYSEKIVFCRSASLSEKF